MCRSECDCIWKVTKLLEATQDTSEFIKELLVKIWLGVSFFILTVGNSAFILGIRGIIPLIFWGVVPFLGVLSLLLFYFNEYKIALNITTNLWVIIMFTYQV